MASSLLYGIRLCIILAVIILMFLPLTFNTDNASANHRPQPTFQPSEDGVINHYNYQVYLHDLCIFTTEHWNEWAQAHNQFGHNVEIKDPATECPAPPALQPQSIGPICAGWQTQWSDGTCVPKSCSTGQRNADGSCAAPPCPPIQPIVRDPRPDRRNRDLNDPHINPEMRFHLNNALAAARAAGFNVEISEAYRSPERSQSLYEDSLRRYEENRANLMAQIEATDDPAQREKLNTQLQKLKRPPAAGAWSSAHNYGMAVDVRLRDDRGNILTGNSPATGSGMYKQLVPIFEAEGLFWYGPGDNGHYEYHPNWVGRSGGVLGGPFLMSERNKAIMEEFTRNWAIFGPWGFNPLSLDWLGNMWNKAGTPCSR